MMTSQTGIFKTPREGEEPLDILKRGFDHIMTNLASGLSMVDYIYLYTLVHDYCTDRASSYSTEKGELSPGSASPHGWKLYRELKSHLTKYLKSMAEVLSKKLGKELLELLVENWDRYTTATAIISNVMAYVNRNWVGRHLIDNKPAHDTYTLSLILWKEILIVESCELRENVVNSVIKLIEQERDGLEPEHLLVKKVLDIFLSVSIESLDSTKQFPEVYRVYFEVKYLDSTAKYYAEKSREIISKHPTVYYMHQIENIFENERKRMEAYLFKTTHELLIITLEHTLIEDHSYEIESEFQTLIKQVDQSEVKLTHKLLSCVPNSLKRLTNLFEYYSRSEGLESIEKISNINSYSRLGSPSSGAVPSSISLQSLPKNGQASTQVTPQLYFNTIVHVHMKLSHIVHNAFDGDHGFISAMDKAFREFVNTNSISPENSKKSIDLLVKYADSILRRDGRGICKREEIEENLNYVITIFKYVNDKDFFQKLYQKMFAKRLVYKAYASEELEDKMINLLKDACGVEYSGKLTRMYNDLEISTELCTGFREYLQTKDPNMNIKEINFLIGGAHWPLVPPLSVPKLPPKLALLTDTFNEFYCKRFSGRKLAWLFNLGKSEILANCFSCDGVPVTLVVPNYQLLILMLYNIKLSYKWSELLEETNLDEDQLGNQLTVLVKKGILVISENASSLGPKLASYRLNTELECTKTKIKIDQQSKKEHIIDLEYSQKPQESDKVLIMQATIIRMLKSSGTMPKKSLICEIRKLFQNKLEITPNEVSEAIDSLIQKEYILKTSGEEDILKYLA